MRDLSPSPVALRDYQARAIDALQSAWNANVRRVCIVAPPGAGKTILGCETVRQFQTGACPNRRVLWLAHRDELITQAANELRRAGLDVGVISPKHAPDPWATVQVASIDTLVARGKLPPAELVIPDECHHYVAETYAPIVHAYPEAQIVGLTATPQRQDGKPLGGMFDQLIIAATYSELLQEGSLVPCRVMSPRDKAGQPVYLGSDLAREPLEAWQALANGKQTFAFAADVKRAHLYASQFVAAGIASVAIDANTPKATRDDALARFRDGSIRVLWNVYVFTEGTNVPEAAVCLLARGVGHAGPYLQITGRVLRPCDGKKSALLIDLSGVSVLHGFPTQDREYALDGRAIKAIGEPLKNCPKCGACIEAARQICDAELPDGTICGHVFAKRPRKAPKIWDYELREAVEEAGGDAGAVPDEAKRREWQRLREVCNARGWSIEWAVKQYQEQGLGQVPAAWLAELTEREKARAMAKWVTLQRTKGFKQGFAKVRFKAMFGAWPSVGLTRMAEAFHG